MAFAFRRVYNRRMPAPPKIDRRHMLDTAVRIFREGGLQELTLRRLAGELGVEAASLYRHVPGKQQLLAQVTLRLFRDQLDRIGPCERWQDWLQSFGRTLWATQEQMHDVANLVLSTTFEAAQLQEMSDWTAEALAPFGIERATALEMQVSIQAMVLGLGGLAGGPSSELVRQQVPFDSLVEHTLSALVIGWEVRLGQERPAASTSKAAA